MKIEIAAAPIAGQIALASPYHPDFPARARQIGGRWDSAARRWTFDVRDVERVRAACRAVYGADDRSAPVVTLRVTADRVDMNLRGEWRPQSLWFAGREVARVFGRDSGARLGDGVVVVAGTGFSSGGSRKNPAVVVGEGTVFEIRDVGQALAESLVADGVEVVQ